MSHVSNSSALVVQSLWPKGAAVAVFIIEVLLLLLEPLLVCLLNRSKQDVHDRNFISVQLLPLLLSQRRRLLRNVRLVRVSPLQLLEIPAVFFN